MNITITEVPPVPVEPEKVVTLELTYEEAQKLRVLVGSIGSEQLRCMIGQSESRRWTTASHKLFYKHFGSTSPESGDAPRSFVDSIYYGLDNAGVRT